jgi:acyl-CoA thioesterase-1
MLIQPGQTVLFQGDSITDCGRDYANPDSLGYGYPAMIAALFGAYRQDPSVRFINRGVSGDRVPDLERRWITDCILLQPDVVSILIGINDVWRRYDSNDPTRVEDFEAGYRMLLQRLNAETKAEVVIMEPFLLPVPEDRRAWREDLDPKIDAIRRIAREFKVNYIPLDGMFAQAAILAGPEFWAEDGVHPSAAGHAFIAARWLESVGAF